MFYYIPEKGWMPHSKKISFKESKTVYSGSADDFSGPEYSEIVIEEIVLTDEQKKRLDTIRNVENAGIDDVKNYVLNGVVLDDQLTVLKEEIKREQYRKRLINLIDWSSVSKEEVVDLLDDFKAYRPDGFYMAGDVFVHDGKLYKSLINHQATGEITPDIYELLAPSV